MKPATLAFALLAAPLVAHAQADITRAQPTLPTETLIITTQGGAQHRFQVEMATTSQQQEIGLMFRPSVASDGGMLFTWPAPQESQMWMRNTIASLDMVFIGPDDTVHHVAENAVPRSLAVIDSHGPVIATLELAAGTVRRLDIRVGDKVAAKSLGDAP